MSNGEFLWTGCSKIIDYGADGKRIHLQRLKQNWRITAILKNPKASGEKGDEFQWDCRRHKELGQFDEWDIEELEPGHLVCIMRSDGSYDRRRSTRKQNRNRLDYWRVVWNPNPIERATL